MPNYVLGIDNGGTATKAAIYDENGRIVALDQAKLETLTPHAMWTERDMEQMWQANLQAIRRCLAQEGIDPADIRALSITGHGNGLYLSTADGGSVRHGIISTDCRAQEIIDEWLTRPDLHTQVQAKTCSTVWAGQPAALLAWLDRYEPDVFEATEYVFTAKDYIRFRLTGEAKIELTDFTGITLANLTTGDLDMEMLDYLGIGHWATKIPPRCRSTEIAGYVSDDVAGLTGLRPGTPVAGGAMDVATCAVAAGLTTQDELCVVTGTWSINQILSPVVHPEEDIFLTTSYPDDSSYLILEASPNGVANLEWYLKNVIGRIISTFTPAPISDREIFSLCERLISEFTPSREDPFFLPFINGTTLTEDGRAGFVGLTQIHDIRHMIRAVYEAVVFCHMLHIEKLRDYRHLSGGIRFTGGAANSLMWAKMFADGFGTDLHIVDAEESGTLGAAILAAVGCGIYPDLATAAAAMTKPSRHTVTPTPEFTDLFAQRFEHFKRYINRNSLKQHS